ncbi:MAG: hypothetical protein CSYNP_03656 [Syntrophus sp. SKADARSKE-3]|nr:hypothetical protein [Syntrophus sp. SKADARSKE-3]
MALTTKQLAEELKSRGYRIAERTIKLYHSNGLLPEATKKGEYMKGVSLVFPDEALDDLLRIFELKGRGFPLKDIKKDLEEMRWQKLIAAYRKKLSQYVKIDGRYYVHHTNLDPRYYGVFGNLWEAVFAEETEWAKHKSSRPPGLSEEAMFEIENRGLWQAFRLFEGKVVYDIHLACIESQPWIRLNYEYGFSWDLLTAIFRKHEDNSYKYVLYPSIDGIRFSEESIGVDRRVLLNEFGENLLPYFEFLNGGEFIQYGELVRHDRYESIKEFIDAFLSGECAFVPDMENREYRKLFLKRFN